MQIELREVSHRYAKDGPLILNDVCLSVQSGDTVSLTGPSGSGKTTLLTILGGIVSPSEGSIRWSQSRGYTKSRLDALSVAWVFQGTNALGRRTVVDNCVLALRARGTKRSVAVAQATTWLDALGIGELSGMPAYTLSGGELQRLGIARALCTRPKLLLTDEPTGQLDSANTARVMSSLLDAKPPETTLICATHDPNVAARCTTQIRIANGRTEVAGSSR